MNKSELVSAIATESGQTKAAVESVLEGFQATVRKALKKGDDVSLIGFGSFKVNKRAARKGVNPKTGESMQIAARKVVKFTAGSQLKDAVN